MEQKKGQIARISLLVVGILLLVLSGTYAFLRLQLTGNKRQVIVAGDLELEILEADQLTLENALPVYDEVGMISTPYIFQLHNKLEDAALYTIRLVDVMDKSKEKLDTSMVKYAIGKDGTVTKDFLSNLENNILDQGRIRGYQTIRYELRLWIDHEIEDDTLLKNKSLSYRIDVEAQPILTPYQDPTLNGCDPILSENLVPVVIMNDKTVQKADDKDAWYDYQNQQWANAVVLIDKTKAYKNQEVIPNENIESYFVWIPRYKYKIFNATLYDEVGGEGNFVNPIEIVFDAKDQPIENGAATGEWLTHPAFQAFDSNGFWVGKFETGRKQISDDLDIKDPSNLLIKPDIYSFRDVTVENAFTLGYNYLRNDESHMMKNTEWGAVAYLSHSIYGNKDSIRFNNNPGMTGSFSKKEPTLGYNYGNSIEGNANDVKDILSYYDATSFPASTTGNISGIFDMSGGAGEYVMGYNPGYIAGASSGLTKVYPDFFENDIYRKYYDLYANDTSTDTIYSQRILGDATGEMGPFQNIIDPDNETRHVSYWYQDLASFPTTSYSWFVRGGDWRDGVEAGIFAFSSATGGAYAWNSFRIVLTPSR